MDNMQFAFSDTVAGYVTQFNSRTDTFGLRTSDGRMFDIALTNTTYAQLVRNLGEPYQDCTGQIPDMLTPERYLFAYGVFYPQAGAHKFEAKSIIFLGRTENDFPFEKQDWWVKQVRSLARFYLRAQFPDGVIDWRNYRTRISLGGYQTGDYRQETDTISRLVYGFATAYLMTGEDDFLTAAEAGTQYLRDHMRFTDASEGIVYWYHAIDVSGANERKVLASEFGDDYDAIPAYEQIYALAGPTQTYRITGDPEILSDIERTVVLFNKYFHD
ncbi:MAG: N-acyl-D-glucosamine 2-epimerase, partial [Chloroflexia bacterium]